MSEDIQSSGLTPAEEQQWETAIKECQEALIGAVQRREDLIIGTESFLSLLMLSYRYARKTYEEAGTPYGKSAAGRLLDGQEWSQFPEVEHTEVH